MKAQWWKAEWWKAEAWKAWKVESSNGPAESQTTEEPFEIPVVRCPDCGGTGQIRRSPSTGHHPATECWFCVGRGLVRAQLVVSLVDLPTGRVSSRNIVPGVLTTGEPLHGQATLNLAAVVKDLAADLGVESVWQPSNRELVRWREQDQAPIALRYPVAEEAELSPEWQFEYQGAAIAREAWLRPHVIFYAGIEPPPKPTADGSLRRLISLAEDLQLDLVVDVRVDRPEQLYWSVRLDLPGNPVPENAGGRFNTLHQALRETSVDKALGRLRNRNDSAAMAPARWLDTSSPQRVRPEDLSWTELSAKLTPLAVQAGGAVGVLRRGDWHFSALEWARDPQNDLRHKLRPVTVPPEPVGELIPLITCSKCAGDGPARCFQCRGNGNVLDGVALTITDLSGRTKHVNWYRLPVAAEQQPTADQPGRQTCSGIPLRPKEVLLDRYYSVGEQAASFGIPPHLLRDHCAGGALELALVDGKVRWVDGDPLVGGYLRAAARRRPGGRLIVLARPEPCPDIEGVFRSVLGLGLTLGIEVRSAVRPRRAPAPAISSWRVAALTATQGAGPTRPEGFSGSTFPSLSAAVAELQAEFDPRVSRALQVGKLDPMPVPQQAVQVRVDLEGIDLVLESLADLFSETTIWICLDLNSCRCFIGKPYHRLASAGAIQETLVPLLAADVEQPRPAELRRLLDLLLDANAPELQLDAETESLHGRLVFGLVLAGLLKCLFAERFGFAPDQAQLDEYAAQAYRDALGEPTEDGEPPPDPAVFRELLASIADPTRTAWHRVLLMDQVSVIVQILGSLLRERRASGAEITGFADQVVEEGMLIARTIEATVSRSAVRQSGEHRER